MPRFAFSFVLVLGALTACATAQPRRAAEPRFYFAVHNVTGPMDAAALAFVTETLAMKLTTMNVRNVSDREMDLMRSTYRQNALLGAQCGNGPCDPDKPPQNDTPANAQITGTVTDVLSGGLDLEVIAAPLDSGPVLAKVKVHAANPEDLLKAAGRAAEELAEALAR